MTQRLFTAIIIMLVCGFSAHAQKSADVHKSDSLYNIGTRLYKEGKFNEAADVFKAQLAIDSILWKDTRPQRIVYTGMWLGSSLYKAGREEEAQNDFFASMYYKSEPVDHRLMIVPDSLTKVANAYAEKENYDMAIKLLEERGRVVKNILGPDHIWTVNNDLILANALREKIGVALEKDLDNYNNNVFSPFNDRSAIHISEKADSLTNAYYEGAEKYYGENSLEYIYSLITSDGYFSRMTYSRLPIWMNTVEKGIKLYEKYYPKDKLNIDALQYYLAYAMLYHVYKQTNEPDGSIYPMGKRTEIKDSILAKAFALCKTSINALKQNKNNYQFTLKAFLLLKDIANERSLISYKIKETEESTPQFYDSSATGLNISASEISEVNTYGVAEIVAYALANNGKTQPKYDSKKEIADAIKQRIEWLEEYDEDERDWNEIYCAYDDIIHHYVGLKDSQEAVNYANELLSIPQSHFNLQ